jgi:hypothetical protein
MRFWTVTGTSDNLSGVGKESLEYRHPERERVVGKAACLSVMLCELVFGLYRPKIASRQLKNEFASEKETLPPAVIDQTRHFHRLCAVQS